MAPTLDRDKDSPETVKVMKHIKALGGVLCEKCSSKEFRIYHLPGKPCPQDSNKAQG